MPTDALIADPELQHDIESETTQEHPGHHHHRDSDTRDVEQDVPDGQPDNGKVALLAYSYWQERGCPNGCPEEDWYRAERELAERPQTSA